MTESSRPRRVTSAARLRAYNLLDLESRTVERRLFALVDAAACVLDHSRGGRESALLVFEIVVSTAVAAAAVRALEGDTG